MRANCAWGLLLLKPKRQWHKLLKENMQPHELINKEQSQLSLISSVFLMLRRKSDGTKEICDCSALMYQKYLAKVESQFRIMTARDIALSCRCCLHLDLDPEFCIFARSKRTSRSTRDTLLIPSPFECQTTLDA